MEKVRVGVAGSGFAARIHLECYKKVYGVPIEIVGVTSLTKENREKFASQYGIKTFDSLEDLISEADVIDISVPPYAHEAITLQALGGGCHVIVEKPFTGYFGDGSSGFRGDKWSKQVMLKEALDSADRMIVASRKSGKKLMYAENWVYTPSVQKEAEILHSTKGQILWIMGEESHNGSHSPSYGVWAKSGGGSLVGKGCHPLTAAIYLKSKEGIFRDGKPIRAKTVSARTHSITKSPGFRDEKYIRSEYFDIEDYSQLHVTFEDGTVADIFSSELVLGGTHSWLEVYANNHRTRCRISPVEGLSTYNPKDDLLRDVYVMEKIGTKQGWNSPTLDELWMNGFYQEIQNFMECVYRDGAPHSGAELGRECIKIIYAGYVSAEAEGEEIHLPES